MNQLRRTISGIRLTLRKGNRYVASRPFYRQGMRRFPVFITFLGKQPLRVLTLPRMSYDRANKFLAAFNNGKTSFEGRIWK